MTPPLKMRPKFYAYMDKIRERVRPSRSPNLPHVTITGFNADYEEMDSYSSALALKLSILPSFTLNFGRPVPMTHPRIPRNISLPVNSSQQMEEVREIVLNQTVTLAQDFARDDLDSMMHHMTLVEGFQRSSVSAAVSAANEYWQDFSFTVDRLYVAEISYGELLIKRELPLIGMTRDEVREPSTSDAELLLAMMFAYGRSLSSKIRLQKLMWLLGELFMYGHHVYRFNKAPLGPYSYDIELKTRALVSEGLVTVKILNLPGGGAIPEYSLTETGAAVAGKCYMIFRDTYGLDIAAMIRQFGNMPLKDLLLYVHEKWPSMRQPGAKGEDTG